MKSPGSFGHLEASGVSERRIFRSRRKFRRFIILETSAVALLVLSLAAGTSTIVAQEKLTFVFQVLGGVAATAAALIPVLFYGLPDRNDRVRRY